MAPKRMSITATLRRSSTASKTHKSDSIKPKPTPKMTSTQHYNDWPNAVGFDAAYEEHEPVDLTVQGHIPAYAAGTLFRTGIGPREINDDNDRLIFKSSHWFDGFSSVHRFQLHPPTADFKAGIDRITYNSRLSSDALIDRIRKTGKWDDMTFGAKYEPCKTFFQKVQAVFTQPYSVKPNDLNNAVTLTINHPGLSSDGKAQPMPHNPDTITTICNRTDSTRMQFLDPTTLKPTAITPQATLDPQLKGLMSGAHPETDLLTGDTYNYNMNFGKTALYSVFKTSASTGKTTILATFNHEPAYLHSMFMSEHFAILCVWNSHFTKMGTSILWNRNLVDSMYYAETPAMWFVVDRRCPQTEGGKGLVAKFESDPFFAFHTINAYEVPSTSANGSTTDTNHNETKVDIICDICAYENLDVIQHYYMDNLISSLPSAHESAQKLTTGRYDKIHPRLRRYRLPSIPLPTSTKSTSTPLSSKATIEFTAELTDRLELPTMHPAYRTKSYNYIYGIVGSDGTRSTFIDKLIKYDLSTRTAKYWEAKGQTPGEAIFVPDPEGKDEDDGVLLSVVLDGYSGKSYLLCLDAKDLREVGRAGVDGAVGFGFHGAYTHNL